LLIYSLDRRNAKNQEKIISKIERYTDIQQKGIELNIHDILLKIQLSLTDIISTYKRELKKINLDNLSFEEQLLQKNKLLKTSKNKELVTKIRQQGYDISHLSDLGVAVAGLCFIYSIFFISKTDEDEVYLYKELKLSAASFIEDAERLYNAISSYFDEERRKRHP
jgi:hypothetical protein